MPVSQEEYDLAVKALNGPNAGSLTDEDLNFIEQTLTEWKSQSRGPQNVDDALGMAGVGIAGETRQALTQKAPIEKGPTLESADPTQVAAFSQEKRKPKQAGAAAIDGVLDRWMQTKERMATQDAVVAEISDPGLQNRSKLKALSNAAQTEYIPGGMLDQATAELWREPSLSEFQASFGYEPEQGEESTEFKAFADRLWLRALSDAMRQKKPIRRASMISESVGGNLGRAFETGVEAVDAGRAALSGARGAITGGIDELVQAGAEALPEVGGVELGDVALKTAGALAPPGIAQLLMPDESLAESRALEARNPGAALAGTVGGALAPGGAGGLIAGAASRGLARVLPGAGLGSSLGRGALTGGVAGAGEAGLMEASAQGANALSGQAVDPGAIAGQAGLGGLLGLGLGGLFGLGGAGARGAARKLESTDAGQDLLAAERGGVSLSPIGGIRLSPEMQSVKSRARTLGASPRDVIANDLADPLYDTAAAQQAMGDAKRAGDRARYLEQFAETRVPIGNTGAAVFDELQNVLVKGRGVHFGAGDAPLAPGPFGEALPSKDMALGGGAAQQLRDMVPQLYDVADIVPHKGYARALMERNPGAKVFTFDELQDMGIDSSKLVTKGHGGAVPPQWEQSLQSPQAAIILKPAQLSPLELEQQLRFLQAEKDLPETIKQAARRDRDQFPTPEWMRGKYDMEVDGQRLTGWSGLRNQEVDDLTREADSNVTVGLPPRLTGTRARDMSQERQLFENAPAKPDLTPQQREKYVDTLASYGAGASPVTAREVFALANASGGPALTKKLQMMLAFDLAPKLGRRAGGSGAVPASTEGKLDMVLKSLSVRALPGLRAAGGIPSGGALGPPPPGAGLMTGRAAGQVGGAVPGDTEAMDTGLSEADEAAILFLAQAARLGRSNPAEAQRLVKEAQKILAPAPDAPQSALDLGGDTTPAGILDDATAWYHETFDEPLEGGGDTIVGRKNAAGQELHPMTETMPAPKHYLEHQATVEDKDYYQDYNADTGEPYAETGGAWHPDDPNDQNKFWSVMGQKMGEVGGDYLERRALMIQIGSLILQGKDLRGAPMDALAEMLHQGGVAGGRVSERVLMEFLNTTAEGEAFQDEPFTVREVRAVLSPPQGV